LVGVTAPMSNIRSSTSPIPGHSAPRPSRSALMQGKKGYDLPNGTQRAMEPGSSRSH
jgi:hypothetical protein